MSVGFKMLLLSLLLILACVAGFVCLSRIAMAGSFSVAARDSADYWKRVAELYGWGLIASIVSAIGSVVGMVVVLRKRRNAA